MRVHRLNCTMCLFGVLSPFGVRDVWNWCKSFILLASLSTQSLNQFADKASKAEALNAEISFIINGVPKNSCQAGWQEPSPPATKRMQRRAVIERV